jgi:OFA family oxalate/formate antiporter-like MFS transporter
MWVNKYTILLAGALVSMPAGSFYSWSVFIKPMAQAFKDWENVSVHGNSLVLVVFGCGTAITGQLEKYMGMQRMSLFGAFSTGIGACLCGLGIMNNSQPLFYLGAVIHGFGLAPCYVAGIEGIMSWWAHRKGFASGYFMMVSSSGEDPSAVISLFIHSVTSVY